MWENVEQPCRERTRPRSAEIHTRRMESEIAVDPHDGSELGKPSQQPQVRRVPELLVTGADEQSTRAGQVEQLLRLALGLHKRLLDVYMGTRLERCARGMKV